MNKWNNVLFIGSGDVKNITIVNSNVSNTLAIRAKLISIYWNIIEKLIV